MQTHIAPLFLLLAVLPAFALTKEDLRRRYPTLEAFAHAFGANDVIHAEDHNLILTAPLPPKPGQFSGMVQHPEDFQSDDIGTFTLDHVILHEGTTLRDLEGALRPDITVWDDPVAKISRGKARYRVGTVRPDLTVDIFPELRDAFPGRYYYIPAFDAVYEAPLSLPREGYSCVAHRRTLNRGHTVRFRMANGQTVSARVSVVRHFGDTRRFLVANHGRAAVVLGEMYPFSSANTDGRERVYYRRYYPMERNPSFALFNEVAGFEHHEHPCEPETTIVYGVKIYSRYLHHFDRRYGPVLTELTFRRRVDPGDVDPWEERRGPVPQGSEMPKGSLTGKNAKKYVENEPFNTSKPTHTSETPDEPSGTPSPKASASPAPLKKVKVVKPPPGPEVAPSPVPASPAPVTPPTPEVAPSPVAPSPEAVASPSPEPVAPPSPETVASPSPAPVAPPSPEVAPSPVPSAGPIVVPQILGSPASPSPVPQATDPFGSGDDSGGKP